MSVPSVLFPQYIVCVRACVCKHACVCARVWECRGTGSFWQAESLRVPAASLGLPAGSFLPTLRRTIIRTVPLINDNLPAQEEDRDGECEEGKDLGEKGEETE